MRFLLLALVSLLALSGCHGKTDPPGEAPTGVTAEPGDGLVLLKWDTLPDLTYWIFFQPGNDVTAAQPGAIAMRNVVSPRVVGNLLNGAQYAFVMNATHADSAAGPSSPVVFATPRRAGADWASGAALGNPSRNLNGIAFNGSRFVAVGDAATIFAGSYSYASTSPPGVAAWEPAISVPTAANLSAVVASGGFLALGTDGSTMDSPDGLTWTSRSTIPAAGMNAIALGGVSGLTTFVAVGNGGAIFRSNDPVNGTWTPVVSNTVNHLFGVSFLNGGFVATGAGGTLLTSPDGINWTPQVSNVPNTIALRSAAFGLTPSGFLHVAVGDAGTIVTSADGGITWVPVAPAPLAQNLNSVVFGSRFVAVGQGGKVVYSDDGLSWPTTSAGSDDLASVVFSPAMYVAVGGLGANAAAK